MNKKMEKNLIKAPIHKTSATEIPYEKIGIQLKRYSFEEKMRICAEYSRKIFDASGDVNAEQLISNVYPWELETFLLFSIMASPEYEQGTFLGKNERKFLGMINGIRNYQPPALSKYKGNIEFIDYYFSATGLIQFDIQETKYYKMFRYSFIFNYVNDVVDMKDEFYRFYDTTYQEFLRLGSFLTLLYGSDMTLTTDVLDNLVNKIFSKATSKLIIDVGQYQEELSQITEHAEDYISCLRPSYKYPFIRRDDKLYLPLPHLLLRSVTSSLLYRLTEDNNDLRDKIGKEVLEAYLLKIMKGSNVYDEVYGEKTFIKEHNTEAKTLDVMVRDADEYIMLDSKASVPSIGLRVYDEESHRKELDKMVEKVVQIYKHLKIFLPNYI